MNIFLYIIIFMIGTLFGSFYTLAVYRIPRKLDITHEHSFCPNCKSKLGFFELIPILSYLILGGKCKHCGQKIRKRYLILEATSGIALVLLAWVMQINVYTLTITKLIEFAFLVLYLVAIFLIAGIDLEKREIEKSVLYYAIGIGIAYIIYLCIMDNTSIYRYAMYLIAIVIVLIIDNHHLKKYAKNSYTISILLLLMIMAIFTGEYVVINTAVITFLAIAMYIIAVKIKRKLNKARIETKEISPNLRIGFYLCISNVLTLLIAIYLISR